MALRLEGSAITSLGALFQRAGPGIKDASRSGEWRFAPSSTPGPPREAPLLTRGWARTAMARARMQIRSEALALSLMEAIERTITQPPGW